MTGAPAQSQSWLALLWDSAETTQEERQLVFKLDKTLLIFTSLGYFVKRLDEKNITNAFFAGMKEDLNMYGNELVHANSFYNAGRDQRQLCYVLGQIPSTILLTRKPPRLVMPTLVLAWGMATLATYSVRNMQTLYTLRFLVGLSEAGFYPGVNYMFGSWYTSRELAKRTTIVLAMGNAGIMLSGFLQTAAYHHLHGVWELAGWRWLMILDATATLPIALFGFAFMPNLPWSPTPSFVLNTQDIELARARMNPTGRKEDEPWTKVKLQRILSGWRFWILPLGYVLFINGQVATPMQYWLKSFNVEPYPVPGKRFSLTQIQLLMPVPVTAFYVFASFVQACISDGPAKGSRWPFIMGGAIWTIVCNATWLAMPLYTNITAHFVYFYLMTLGAAGSLVLNWMNEILREDNELRALCIAWASALGFLVDGIAPNFVWKTTEFPRATVGYYYSTSVSVYSTTILDSYPY
ncbi:major facilitator superfamily domain-containing protein [Roridomyces roridus]|uniref:Major facilitator superfamily domain-containing protein n=1 Tax=Roridomyces roridus TaxID=1738132 RepID=A0AAD7C7M7_9AGAR|nr:major facilitator superfamily domain-containing protein [Roridomyces roridus]